MQAACLYVPTAVLVQVHDRFRFSCSNLLTDLVEKLIQLARLTIVLRKQRRRLPPMINAQRTRQPFQWLWLILSHCLVRDHHTLDLKMGSNAR